MGLYNLILFLVRNNNSNSFWLNYGFIMFGFVMFFVSLIIKNTKNNAPKVTGLPIGTLSFLYLAIVFIVGTIFMFFHAISFNVVLIVHCVLAALYLLVYVPAIFNYIGKENK